MRKEIISRALVVSLLSAIAGAAVFAPVAFSAAPLVQATSTAVESKVAPGESLTFSVKLVNVGGGGRVDVVATYTIIDAQGKVIYNSAETVAVETTASFVKSIPIPSNTPPGQYTAKSSILYPGQAAPATSLFVFTVEYKIFGFFQRDFYLFAGMVVVIALIAGVGGRFWVRRRIARTGQIDYSTIPADMRVFYELISDTVTGMRLQVGERAMVIAQNTKGITIDRMTGRVLTLTEKPSKVIADLVSQYEKTLGTKVSFAFRRP